MNNCRVCNEKLGKEELNLAAPSVTSMSENLNLRTKIYLCRNCAHCQSPDLPNVSEYYDNNYKISLKTDDFDQLYETKGDTSIFRTEHQATLISELKFKKNSRVLDFGCGKATTLKNLLKKRNDINPFVFEVSRDYKESWDKWIPENNQATYTIPQKWHNTFDLLICNFVLEHVMWPTDILDLMYKLICPGGLLFFTVPNPLDNSGDLLVVDHLNKFTISSIKQALINSDFNLEEISDKKFRGAFTVVASKNNNKKQISLDCKKNEISSLERKISKWGSRFEEIKKIDKKNLNIVIYGAGFYGTLFYNFLKYKPTCFLDKSIHLNNRKHLGIPVLSPEKCPQNIDILLIGLNPEKAKSIFQLSNKWIPKNCKVIFVD